MRPILHWLSEIDWAAIVGSALVLAFLIPVLLPGFEGWSAYEEARYQAAQNSPPISTSDAAALAAITGTLVVVNSGGTSAKITASGFRIYFGDGDLDGNARFMGFCRRWSGRETFAPGDNPEYEYSD